ncbi:MAG: hypothetical protein QF535_04420 [Anaerolineales bacterium]|nr:hypothetical protein [Anaerolineales bacterium]
MALTKIGTLGIADDAITAAKLPANSVAASELADDAVDTAAIANLAVTTAKIAADAIDGTKLADDAVNSEHYTNGSIDTVHIGDNQVTGAKIAMGSDAAGDILTYTGTDYVRLPKGTASQTLKMNSGATAVEWGTAGASLSAAQEWTAQQNFNNTALTFDATQDWALTANQVATLTLTANTTFDAPTQMVDGAFYSLIIIQDGTGGRTASWNTVFKWAGGTAPTLTTTASAKDIFVWRSDGTNMYEVGRQLNVS